MNNKLVKPFYVESGKLVNNRPRSIDKVDGHITQAFLHLQFLLKIPSSLEEKKKGKKNNYIDQQQPGYKQVDLTLCRSVISY